MRFRVDVIICTGSRRYRTVSGSDRMLTLNCSLKTQRIAGLNVASGRYRSRFSNGHRVRHACVDCVLVRTSIHSAPLCGFFLDFVSRKGAEQISKGAKKNKIRQTTVDSI